MMSSIKAKFFVETFSIFQSSKIAEAKISYIPRIDEHIYLDGSRYVVKSVDHIFEDGRGKDIQQVQLSLEEI